jgi:hypothetical protein
LSDDREPAEGTIAVGPVIADEEYEFAPAPDRVSVVTGGEAARAALPGSSPTGPADGSSSGTSSDQSGQSGPGTASGSADGSADKPADGVFDLTMGARVETTGHLATVHVGVGGGLDGGLAALSIDFGDRTEPFELDDDRIAAIGSRGQVMVTHTYEPTLTRQPQIVVVTATDRAGRAYERTLRFDTRAAYRLYYSPLMVTALSRCDTFGKGDFELTWQNDQSLPLGKTSTFKLDQDESYVENRFVSDVGPVHYQEPPELFLVDGEPEFLYLKIEEKDPPGAGFLAVWRYGFGGSFVQPSFLTSGPVAQLGNHHYRVSMGSYAGSGSDCTVSIEFTAHLVMVDQADR